MKYFILCALLSSFSTFAEMIPMTDKEMRNTNGKILDPFMEEQQEIGTRVRNPQDLMMIAQFAKELRETAAAGVPEELSIAINTQNFLDNLVDPNQELDYIGQIIKEVFERAGVKFDLSFEDTQTRGNYKMIYLDQDGNELLVHDRIDFIGRINVENIRFGDTETSIGNIYISNWDWAPGNVMRIQVRE